jgi:hypothetical protein
MARNGSSPTAREQALACWRDVRFAYRKHTDTDAYKEAVRTSFMLANL